MKIALLRIRRDIKNILTRHRNNRKRQIKLITKLTNIAATYNKLNQSETWNEYYTGVTSSLGTRYIYSLDGIQIGGYMPLTGEEDTSVDLRPS